LRLSTVSQVEPALCRQIKRLFTQRNELNATTAFIIAFWPLRQLRTFLAFIEFVKHGLLSLLKMVSSRTGLNLEDSSRTKIRGLGLDLEKVRLFWPWRRKPLALALALASSHQL